MIDWKDIARQINPVLEVYSQQQMMLGMSYLAVFIIINLLIIRYLLKKRPLSPILYSVIIVSDLFLLFNGIQYVPDTVQVDVYKMNNFLSKENLLCSHGACAENQNIYTYKSKESYILGNDLIMSNTYKSTFDIKHFYIEALFYENISKQYKAEIDSTAHKHFTRFLANIDSIKLSEDSVLERKEKERLIVEYQEISIADAEHKILQEKLAKNTQDYFFVVIRTKQKDIPYLLISTQGETIYKISEQKLEKYIFEQNANAFISISEF